MNAVLVLYEQALAELDLDEPARLRVEGCFARGARSRATSRAATQPSSAKTARGAEWVIGHLLVDRSRPPSEPRRRPTASGSASSVDAPPPVSVFSYKEGVALTGIRLEEISEAHLASFLTEGVPEGRLLEYKETVGLNDEAKLEFLADVSSFANASGGDLLVGISEQGGRPLDLTGMPADQSDAEVLRLENILRDGLEPRIPGVRLRAVAIDDGAKMILVIRIPRSWAAPHMVTFRGRSRFYSRNSAGKYQLDVGELRAAFAASEAASERVRSFRLDRLARLVADEGPVPLISGPKLVLHVVPLTIADPTVVVDLQPIAGYSHDSFGPLRGNSWNTRINFDGMLAYQPGMRDQEASSSYTQVFRSGAIEGADGRLLPSGEGEKRRSIASTSLEEALIDSFRRYLTIARDIGVAPPVAVATSLLGVRGMEMAVDIRRFERAETIDRNDLLVPELLIEDFHGEPDVLIKPQLDAIWNAVGFPGSPNYDKQGRWAP